MEKNRCSICCKKLVDGVCPECGWRESYTEISSENKVVSVSKKKTGTMVWSIVCIVLIFSPLLMKSSIFQMIVANVQEHQVVTSIPESTYENTSRKLSDSGESVKMTLEEGNYIVGIDIAEGVYKINVIGKMAMIDLKDDTNQINNFSILERDSDSTSSYLEDYRLYEGATVHIENGQIEFSSGNAQVKDLQMLPPNESQEEYPLEDGAVAGADFPEGTYDITVNGGDYGMVTVSHPTRDEDLLGFHNVLGSGERDLKKFRNVEFPKGTLVEIDNVKIMLVPSTRNSLIR